MIESNITWISSTEAEPAFIAGMIDAGVNPSTAQTLGNKIFIQSFPYSTLEEARAKGFQQGRVLQQIDESGSAVSDAQKRQITKDVSPAEIESLTDEEITPSVNIETRIDPANDGDLELYDIWSFESEIEVMFDREPMATSFEDVQAETDVYDLDIIDPVSQIDVSSEIDQAEQLSPDDEISSAEESIPFEQLTYIDFDDLDLDFTDNSEDFYIPEQAYDTSEAAQDQINLSGSELDDMSIDAEADFFDTITRTFAQDETQPFLAQSALSGNMTLIDASILNIPSLTDDATASIIDYTTSEDLGNKFFRFLDDDPILGQNSFDFVQ